MDTLNTIVQIVLMIVGLVCYVAVIKELWDDNSTYGIIILVTTLCTGIGGLVLFIWGWFQHELRPTMVVWTVVSLLLVAMQILFGSLF